MGTATRRNTFGGLLGKLTGQELPSSDGSSSAPGSSHSPHSKHASVNVPTGRPLAYPPYRQRPHWHMPSSR
jgi:hypothetical protein